MIKIVNITAKKLEKIVLMKEKDEKGNNATDTAEVVITV